MTDLAILIPAAGASRRMRGSDKLLESVDGHAQLRRVVAMALATGARVIVTLPDSGPLALARKTALSGLRAQICALGDWHEGMAASLRAGARAAGQADALMILLPDMPDITESDLAAIIAAFAEDPTRPVRACAEDGRPGHPVIFPRRLFQELMVLTGDRGGMVVMAGEDVRPFPLPGDRAITDLDTPEDWARWRASKQV